MCAMLIMTITWIYFYSNALIINNLELYFQVTEVYNFSQDDLMTEDIFILDCHTEIFVWVGQQVDPKSRMQALTIGEV